MNLVGLITEYNPFHNGHLYHLMQAKKETHADATVVVMSGNFVQRGTPALLDKWTRTEMALKGGADLVIELPLVYATGSAELFAQGAVRTLHGLTKVNNVIFGSESGSIEPLKKVGHFLSDEPKDFKEQLKQELSSGFAFPVARERALRHFLSADSVPTLPNDILGIEYIKAGYRLNTHMSLGTIQRLSSDYHDLDTDQALSSATAIRAAYFDGRLHENQHTIPQTTYDTICEHTNDTVHPEALGQLLLYKLRTTPPEVLRGIHDVSEGLEFRIKDAALRAQSYEQLVSSIKTKRYVRTRIQRVLLNILFNIEKDFIQSITTSNNAAYARVLGFTDTGRQVMNHIRKDAEIPLITNVNKFVSDTPLISKMLEKDMIATDVYSILRGDNKGAQDRLKQPIYLR